MSRKKMKQKPGWAWNADKGFHKTTEKRKKMNKPPTPPKPGSPESEMLNELLDLVNGVPPEMAVTPAMAAQISGALSDVPAVVPPAPAPKVFVESGWKAAPAESSKPCKLFFTGRLCSGKDYLAKAAGCKVLGFADPLYAVASYYFDVEVTSEKNKDLPGMRAFLQTVGQWGRGTVSEKYPLTPARALFVKRVRSDGACGLFGNAPVEWESYGKNEDIWLDSLIARVAALPAARIAVTNCRFQNEFERLQKENYDHWHCMCNPKTWAARLAKQNLTPESPAVKDLSEQLAAKLDASVIRQCSAQKSGPKLKVIWSDEAMPAPSSRLHSVADFLRGLQ